jgi:endoglucanase
MWGSIPGTRWLRAALIALALFVVAPAVASAAPLSITVSGNHFVNGAGQTIRLLGVNHSSAEYACVDGYGYDDGHFDAADAATVASWHANAVRIPLNEDCWLGINGQPNSDQGPPAPLTANGYRQAIEHYVATLNAEGVYAILDLHWSAPSNEVADTQQPMPDLDHSVAFWTSVASTFKADPAVVFDLFNEPFSPTDPRSGTDTNPAHAVSWSCWKSGGCSTASFDSNGTEAATYPVAGMQSLITAIRGTGAKQPVLLGGLNFANDLTGWLTHEPTDPLKQAAASFHNYQGQQCDTVSCWNQQIAPVAAKVPVVTGEFDEDDFDEAQCPNKNPSTFDADYMDWADQHGVGYLAWGWWVLSQSEQDDAGCSAYDLLASWDGTPAAPNGTALHDHLAALAAAPPAGGGPGGGGTGSGGGGGGNTGGGANPGRPTLRHLKTQLLGNGRSLHVTLSSSQAASGSIRARTVQRYPSGRAAKRAHIRLGSARFKLHAGKSATVALSLHRPARRLLAAHHTVRTQVTITLVNAAHERTVAHRTITLRRRSRH